MELLAAEGHCSPEVLAELARTEAIRRRMREARLLPPRPKERRPFEPERPTPKQRQTASRFGIELPKPKKSKVEKSKVGKPRLSGTERIGGWRRPGRDLRLDRAQLFDRVWSVPVDKLAREWRAVRPWPGEGMPTAPGAGAAARVLGEDRGGPARSAARTAEAAAGAGRGDRRAGAGGGRSGNRVPARIHSRGLGVYREPGLGRAVTLVRRTAPARQRRSPRLDRSRGSVRAARPLRGANGRRGGRSGGWSCGCRRGRAAC
jgi:hypothetical protein